MEFLPDENPAMSPGAHQITSPACALGRFSFCEAHRLFGLFLSVCPFRIFDQRNGLLNRACVFPISVVGHFLQRMFSSPLLMKNDVKRVLKLYFTTKPQ
jgi:hypothetical protein